MKESSVNRNVCSSSRCYTGGVHYNLRKQSEFHVVSNGKRPVVIQGGSTCNPSACINGLTLREPKLADSTIQDLYKQLIEFDYRGIKGKTVEVDAQFREESINFSSPNEAGYKTQKVAQAFNEIVKGHKLLKKYRFESRMIKNSEQMSNLQIARILLREFEGNNKMPLMIGTKIYKQGRGNKFGGHELTLENIKEIDGEIWMKIFDSNGRNFVVKAGPEMRMDSLHELRSTDREILMQTSPFREFDLWGDYILLKSN